MFLNTLQLIAHMPLLNTLMPANLHLFLAKYLDFVRLSPAGLLEDNFTALERNDPAI